MPTPRPLRAGEGPERGCRIGWTTLAGIGWVESHHGTLGGRTLREDGRSSTPVLGPALDGDRRLRRDPGDAGRAGLARRRPVGARRRPDAVPPRHLAHAGRADGDRRRPAPTRSTSTTPPPGPPATCVPATATSAARGAGQAAVLSYNRSRAYVDEVYAAASTYAAAAGS